jgi:hypothetical protein
VTYAKGSLRIEATIRCGSRTATLTTPEI